MLKHLLRSDQAGHCALAVKRAHCVHNILRAGEDIVDAVRSLYGTASTISCAPGRYSFSNAGAKGIGVNGAPTRFTGASIKSKASSAIVAAISAPIPQVRTAS